MKIGEKRILRTLKKDLDLFVILLLFAAVVVVLSICDKNFLNIGNFQSIAFQFPVLGLFTLAMVISMLTGGINLSIIAAANFSCIIMAKFMGAWYVEGENAAGIIVAAMLIGLGIGIFAGLLNGIIITQFKITPIIATLSTQMLFDGISTVITKGYIVSGLPESFQILANGTVAGIPFSFLVFVVMAGALGTVLSLSGFGKKIYMYGSNATATRFSGVSEQRLVIGVYVISNSIASFAAILMLSRFNSASVGYSTAYLLQTVLICVLGGVNPNGGRGKVMTVVIALLVLQLVSNGFTLMGINAYLSTAIWGILLILVIMLRAEKK